MTRLRASASALLGALVLAAPAWGAHPDAIAGLGDSLTQAYGSAGVLTNNPAASWSTGTDSEVDSHYLRLSRLTTTILGNAYNNSASGSKMAAVPAQATTAIDQGAEYVTILSGTNDVCAPSITTVDGMTSVESFGLSLNQALTTLSNGLPADGRILVASIPDWLKLREAFKDDSDATTAWALNDVCPLIMNPATSDADRAAADQRIKDYNAQAQIECAKFAECTYDGGAVFGLTFGVADLAPDYFHLSRSGQAKLAAAAWDAGPYSATTAFYDSLVKDGGCTGCQAIYDDPALGTTIASAANSSDSAYGSKDFGGSSGAPGRVFTRTVVTLEPGQTLEGTLRIFYVRDTSGAHVYNVFLTPAREIRLRAPTGGLASSGFTLATGVVVPNDGSARRIEVSALANDSVIVRVDGVERVSKTGLSGASTGNQRYLWGGLVQYGGTSSSPVKATHAHVGASTSDWLGDPGGGGGDDTTPPAAPTGLGASATAATTVELDWADNGESDLAGYNVYRATSSGGPYTKLNPSTSVSASAYTDTSASAETQYFYAVSALDTAGNESALSAETSVTTPPASDGDTGPYEAFTTDPGCAGCTLAWRDPELEATIAGAANDVDTAYASDDVGGASGLAGRVYTRTVFRLPDGQTLAAQLYVFQVQDVDGRVVYELFVNKNHVLRLASPAGGLRSTSLNQSTGVTVPNDGTPVRIEVAALANDSVEVRVDGVGKLNLTGLSGAVTGNQRFLHVGVLHYTGTATTGVNVFHAHVGASTSDWLGAP